MRWVFLGAIDVPAHAKSGITERQTRSFWLDDRLPAHLTARDGDKWRTLPAECTHISDSITLSQHKNSHCQSGSVIYANTQKSANICVAIRIFAFFWIQVSYMPSLRLLCVCEYVWVICLALLCFYYDISLTKKSLWWRISHIPYSHNLYQIWMAARRWCMRKTLFSFFHYICLLKNFRLRLSSSNVRRHISSNQLVRCVSGEVWWGCFTVKDIYRTEGSLWRGNPKLREWWMVLMKELRKCNTRGKR